MDPELAVLPGGKARFRAMRGPDRWTAVLVIGYLAQVLWRVGISMPVTGPIAHADEDGYLLGARVLAGGPGATLPAWSIMRSIGYPLLLTPAYWMADKPAQVYQLVHVINALVLAATFPLGYLIARRMFGLGRGWSAGIAFVVATLPSMVFFGQFALTDALLPTVVMALLLLVYGMFAERGDRRRPVDFSAVGAGALAAYAASTHVRGLVMLVVVTVVVALGAVRRWLPVRAAIAYAVPLVVVFAAGRLGNGWLEGQLFTGTAYSATARVFGRLTSVTGLARIACDGAGQLWHLCTSTYGLAALGLAAAVWALVRREWPRATRTTLGAALAITLGIALATSAGTPTEGRVNNHVYGRYVSIVGGFWAIVAVVALLRAGWRRSAWLVAGGTAITALSLGAVMAYAGRRLPNELYVDFDAPELSFLSGDYGGLHLYQMTLYAIGFMVVFAVTLSARMPVLRLGPAGRTSGWLAAGTLAATAVLSVVAMVAITVNISRAWVDRQYNAEIPQLVRDAGVRPGDTVAESSTLGWWVNLRHQHEVYWAPVPRFAASGPPPGAPMFVVSGIGRPTDWNGTPYGYRLLLVHDEGTNGTWAVWRRG